MYSHRLEARTPKPRCQQAPRSLPAPGGPSGPDLRPHHCSLWDDPGMTSTRFCLAPHPPGSSAMGPAQGEGGRGGLRCPSQSMLTPSTDRGTQALGGTHVPRSHGQQRPGLVHPENRGPGSRREREVTVGVPFHRCICVRWTAAKAAGPALPQRGSAQNHFLLHVFSPFNVKRKRGSEKPQP